MAQDLSNPSSDDETPDGDLAEAPRLGRGLLFAGVAMAGLLGVGLGLWARPADSERHPGKAGAMRAVAVAPKPTRSLEIVVDDRPAEIGGPIEVMAQGQLQGQLKGQAQGAGPAVSHFAVDAPAPAPAEVDPAPMLAPQRPPEGLVKVQSVSAPPPAPAAAPAPKAAPVPAAPARPAPAKLVKLVKLVKAAEPKRQVQSTEPRVQKVKASPAPKPAKLVKVKAEAAAKPAKVTRVAKVERAAKTRIAKAEARLIKVETRAKPKLSALLHVLKTKPQPQPKAEPKVRVARAEKPVRAPKVQLVASRSEKKTARPKVEKAVARPATPKAPQPARLAPARLTKAANRCASPDPGAALVCADPSLGAADRELARAYRQAEAAGVPAWRLQQQQQHWVAARANAARQAPWAVRDVYQARIAELHDQARSAASDY